MIDPKIEKLLSLHDAAGIRWLPKRPNFATVWRWATKGVKGGKVKLETVRLGRGLFTSEAAVERFMVASTADAPPESPSQADADAETEKQLSRLGAM